MSRALALPGMTVTVREMVAGLREVAGDRVAERLTFERDPFIEKNRLRMGHEVPPRTRARDGVRAGP